MEATPIDALVIEAQVAEVLPPCLDPEIPVNIYELGLVYEINVDASRADAIKMTLTSPGSRSRCSSSGRKRNTILADSTLRGSQHMTITKSAVLMAATAVLSTSAPAQLPPSRVLTLDAAARDGESHG